MLANRPLYYVTGVLARRATTMNTSASGQGSKADARSKAVPASRRSEKLRGMNKDTPDVRLSKTISWLLRHGAKGEGLAMRTDGYVKVEDLLVNPKIASQNLDLAGLQEIVKGDAKQRYALQFEPVAVGSEEGVWWIRANQGHSINAVQVEMRPISSIGDIPSKCAVHGTSMAAWRSIAAQGLSKMKRNHIHLAQGVPSDHIISGMRKSSQVFIFINVQRAMDAGIKFSLSENGVVLTTGNETGFLLPEFFERVVTAKGEVLFGSTTAAVDGEGVEAIVDGTSQISIQD